MKFDDFFKAATGTPPYAYQRTFATGPVLPDILEAPTGSGKTATAVLGWLFRRLYGTPAQRAEAGRRLVFCLPMRTLVEQTERSVQNWRQRLQLESALGVHSLLGGAVDEAWESYPDRDVVLIGTQDQLLSRALMRGYAMSRYRWPIHFALLNNDCLWVMDEVQLMGVGASTAAQLQAFRERFGVAGSAKTIWMTATLAESRLRTIDVRREFTRQPFTSEEPALERRLNAKKTLSKAPLESRKKGDLRPIARAVLAAHEPGTMTLVVVNRVARAQELRALMAKDGKVPVEVIHSRFRPDDRKRIVDTTLNGSFEGVLIATQAIEAGVDISAKNLFTELAPWPSLVQRFGRLNRAGEHRDARAVWIDIDTNDPEACLPYEARLLEKARKRVLHFDDVGPASLGAITMDPEEPVLPVIRQKDLLELFDTEPDLAGHDVDISAYIRAAEDRDVQVAWRDLGREGPAASSPELRREELCSVPVYALQRLVKQAGDRRLWRFDSLRKQWVKVDRLFSGLTVVADVSLGGYSGTLGLTLSRDDKPDSLQKAGNEPDHDEADQLTHGSSFVTLKMHAEDTAEELVRLLESLGDVPCGADALLLEGAARWHDAGKVHLEFQKLLTSHLPLDDPRREVGPWAKSDKSGGRNARRFFRHELASALSWLAASKPDLGAYVIAAHHGKVRLSLRARPGEEPPPDGGVKRRFAHGVWEGDELPEADLGQGVVVPAQHVSLACMELGGSGEEPSWADRMSRLLAEYGPFRLAYLEMLVRIADWRASQKRCAPSADERAGGANV